MSQDCYKCHFLLSHVEAFAEKYNESLNIIVVNWEQSEIKSVPTLEWNNTQYDYESIVDLISNKE